MKNINDKFTFKCGLTINNRMLLAPMTTKMSFFDGVVSSDEIAYYRSRARDMGAIITGAANVSELGKGWEGELGVSSDLHLEGLRKLANAIHDQGSKAILQIFHAGRMTYSYILRGKQPVSASAIAATRKDSEQPRSLEENEIHDIISDFANATKRAIAAGFDGVELHGANTYLLQQFFSPHSNRRLDSWGGDRQKRFSFIKAVVDAVIKVVQETKPNNFLVGYRFSPEEIENPGISLEDTLFLVRQLANEKLDYLHISLRNFEQKSINLDYQNKTILAYIYETIAKKIPLIGVGNIWTNQDINKALENCDLVAIGRATIINPNYASLILENKSNSLKHEVSKQECEALNICGGLWDYVVSLMGDKIK
ncbi:NADH-dependent flavin oxidoreductase [Metamycoplasma arthritidis]|uniref:NADH-dependent flavin oxidoreductase n=1 Tax=Metamycoplasma arthritidis TaxID=2111 RepID=UPI0010052022|nr:NADH-dependent flavin oxidoreductase [Metamycoplasma arthritidis]VEU79093.1 NADH-dependent flavin oxidoreductase [Metamycoplasma arthritidis]